MNEDASEARREPGVPEVPEAEPEPLGIPLPLAARAYDYPLIERRREREDRTRFKIMVITLSVFGLALTGLFFLILLNRPVEQINLWISSGVAGTGAMATAAVMYFFGSRGRD